ncbi:MAG: histidine kinase [Bacteroidota bacterium]|nr:histidine kinase [Bacteroidota bacterium]
MYFLCILALFFIFITYSDLFFQMPDRPRFPGDRRFINPERLNAIYLFILVIFISGGLRFMNEWKQIERKNKMIEEERLRTELSFLHSQINPHFLFNTLNSIYSLALLGSSQTADAVMRLSSLMRYVLQDVKNENVPLEMEIQCIQNYIELQKMRLNEKADIQLSITGDFSGYQIPPMILIPFIENAFKYGTSSHETSRVIVDLEMDQTTFKLKTTNQIFALREKSESFGIGFRNSERRLNLIYPGKHELSIVRDKNFYVLNLKIDLS